MDKKGRRRLKRFGVSSVIAVLAVTCASLLLTPFWALLTGAVGFLGVAVASDDDLGSCLIFAVFFLIGLTLLSLALVAAIKVNAGFL